MISQLKDKIINKKGGNKSTKLQILINNNFNVPNGIIITNDILQNIDKYVEEIMSKLNENKAYAIRSSSTKEDMEDLAFAGLYNSYLNVIGRDNIIESVKKCYNSRFNKENIEYCKKNNINTRDLDMSVIVQEMVEAEYSGIAFTINPITGNDKEFVVEVVRGLGEKNVGGKAKPNKYIYNWYDERLEENNIHFLKENVLKELNRELLKIQILFGYPVDVEFAVKDDKIYFLQVRPITKIMFSKLDQQWTTANFRDGGVSAKVCLPLMASIYSKAFTENEINAFTRAKFLKIEEMDEEIIKYIYGKLYWNVSINKKVVAKAPRIC